METKSYHHGNLRSQLIEEGIALVNEFGINNFSLRKVVKRIGVSPTACYNHFSSKEDLLESMKKYVNERFEKVLLEAVQDVKVEYAALEMGKAYVQFFVDNPNYFPFIYDNEDYSIELKQDDFVGDYKAFCIFRDISLSMMESVGIPKKQQCDNLVVMWAVVQGLSAMANMKGFHYEGNWSELTGRILENNIRLRGE